MDKSNQFEEIPDDVKKEMLMLFETYSKNELINKLRSLRESHEKNLVQSETDTVSTSSKDFHEIPNPESDAIDKTHNQKQNNSINISFQCSNNSSSQKTNQQNSKFELSQSDINLVSNCPEVSGAPNYDYIKSDPLFNPVVLLQKFDLTKTYPEISHSITEDVNSQNIGINGPVINIKEVKNRKSVRSNKKMTKSLAKTRDKYSSKSAADKPLEICSETIKVENVLKDNTKSKKKPRSSNKLKKDSQSKAKQEITSINGDCNIKPPAKATSTISKKINPKNKLSKVKDITLEIPVNVNSKSEPLIASDKNKRIIVENLVKKEGVKTLKSKIITISCDTDISPDLKVSNKDLQTVSFEASNLINVKGEKHIDNIKNTHANALKKTRKRKPLNKNVRLTAIADTGKQTVANSESDTIDLNHCLSNKISSSAQAFNCVDNGNITSTDLNFNEPVNITRSMSLGKGSNRCLLNNETVSNLDKNVLMEKTSNCSVKTKEQSSLFNVMNESLVSKISSNDFAILTESTSDNQVLSGSDDSGLIKVPKFADSENVTSTDLNPNDPVNVTRSKSLKKRSNRCLFNSETVSNLGQSSTFVTDANQSLISRISSEDPETVIVSPVFSAESGSNDQISSSKLLPKKKMSNKDVSNSEIVSNLKQRALNKKISCGSKDGNGEKRQYKKETHKSKLSVVQNTTSKLQENMKANKKFTNCEDSDEMKQNAEEYFRLSKLCSQQGLNLDDIFRRKEVIEMMEKYKNHTDAIVFLGPHRNQSTGKVEPVIHAHKSKKVLLETISAIQNKTGATSKVSK